VTGSWSLSEVAVLEQQYREHGAGWDHYLPRLAAYAPTVGVVIP